MFNFEKFGSSLQSHKSKISKKIEKWSSIDTKRSSPLPNPMDDSIKRTEEFWRTMKDNGSYVPDPIMPEETRDQEANTDDIKPPKKAA